MVRDANIVDEFNQHGLTNWLRDLVGILKTTFALLLLIGVERGVFAVVGARRLAELLTSL